MYKQRATDFAALVAKLTGTLDHMLTHAQEIEEGGNGVSYGTLAFEHTILVEKAEEQLGDIAKYLAAIAGDGEDVSSLDELDARITRLCDDREEDMCYAATGRYMDPDRLRDEQIDRDLIDDREPRSDHWDA